MLRFLRGHGLGASARSVAWLTAAVCAIGPAGAGEAACFTNERYHVVSMERDEGVGATVAVTVSKGAPAPKTCALDRAKADYVLFGEPGNEDAMYPKALVGDHLIFDEGTGTQRGLVVMDLRDRRRILSAPSDAFRVEGGQVIYWERGPDAKRRDCPRDYDRVRKQGGGLKLATEKELTLATGAVTPLAGRRCEETGDE